LIIELLKLGYWLVALRYLVKGLSITERNPPELQRLLSQLDDVTNGYSKVFAVLVVTFMSIFWLPVEVWYNLWDE
jgi:hypothetical protein